MKQFRFFKQQDSMQCGQTCLRMICQYYGKRFSSDELDQICMATREGISMLSISETSEELGLHTICGHITINKLSEAPLPCILHWNQNHFVVLYKIRKGKYYVADPAKGLLWYDREEFENYWLSTISQNEEKGIALFLKPTPKFYRIKDGLKDIETNSFRFLFGYIKQYRKYFWQILVGLIVGCCLQLLLPFLTQAIVDIGIRRHSLNFIWLVLIGQLMITISRTTMDFLRRWILLHISMRINISLVSDFFIKLLQLPMSFFDTKQTGDLIQRINDHSRVGNFLTSQTLNVMFSILSFIVFGTVLLCYSLPVFFIFTIGSFIYAGWIALFLNKRKILDYEIFAKQSENSNKTYEFVTSVQEIKLQNCEQRRRWEWEDVQADLFTIQMKSMKLQQTQEAGNLFINELKNIIITVVSATAVINGNMTLGMMLAVQYIIGQLNSPIEQLMDFIYALQDVKISLERISGIHQRDNEDSKTTILPTNESKDIEMRNISFRYEPYSIKKTIDNIDIIIPKGKITAIVGASGSGKTTLIKLMLGYYPVEEGHIMIDGVDICKINKKAWRKRCGVVMQDGVIFSESIARNIAIDDGEIDKTRLIEAAEIACIKDTIQQLPLGFNTKIGTDGIGLSQGQKQRILIARAVYKNPDFIFLDEATNSLDATNERAIVENLNSFYNGRTVVVVAHRLSTVKDADSIVVLAGGRVVETGNHTSLIERQGAYYNLVKNQLELGN